MARAHRIVGDLVAGRWDNVQSTFDDRAKAASSSAKLELAWDSYKQLKGEFTSQGDAEVIPYNGTTVVNVSLKMTKSEGQCRVIFDPDGRVGGFFLLDPANPATQVPTPTP